MATMLLALVAALLMATVHVVSPRLKVLDRTPRSLWLSLAGGISVASVFVHLLPELAHLQRAHFGSRGLEVLLYLLAAAGLVV